MYSYKIGCLRNLRRLLHIAMVLVVSDFTDLAPTETENNKRLTLKEARMISAFLFAIVSIQGIWRNLSL